MTVWYTQLFTDRVVKPQTQNRRDGLLSNFESWYFETQEVSILELLDGKEVWSLLPDSLFHCLSKELGTSHSHGFRMSLQAIILRRRG